MATQIHDGVLTVSDNVRARAAFDILATADRSYLPFRVDAVLEECTFARDCLFIAEAALKNGRLAVARQELVDAASYLIQAIEAIDLREGGAS